MPARRLPTQIHEARGSYRKNPARRRDPTPVVTKRLGRPSETLSDTERAAWLEIVRCAPPGVLTRADRLSVELAARLLAELRAGSSTMTTSRLTTLRHLLESLGMAPAARANVSVAPKPRRSRLFDVLEGRR